MAVAVVLALLVMGSKYHWLARPQILTIALLGWTYAQLVDFEAGTASWRRLCWLPPVFVLWTNLHGGALGGIGTVAFVFAGWCGASSTGRRTPGVTACSGTAGTIAVWPWRAALICTASRLRPARASAG